MTNRFTYRALFLLGASCALSLSAQADLIFGIPSNPDAVSFGDGGVSNCSSGPTTTTDGGFNISTDGAACFPYSQGWSFLDNGQWLSLPALVDDSGTTTITIDLGGSYSAVWGQMDYYLDCTDFSFGCSYAGNDPTITALDKKMNVLQSFDLAGVLAGESQDTDYLAGGTLGISQSTADIAYFQISGDYIAITNISLTAPEPRTTALAVLALGAVAIPRKHRVTFRRPKA
jgi:hypothetical protein